MSRRDRTPSIAFDEHAGHRHARLQDLVERELAALLRDEMSDPRLDVVRVARVVLSVDYRHARVHFTIVRATLGSPRRGTSEGHVVDVQGVAHALEKATSFLRGRLAETIDLKRVPDLRFVFDGEAAL